MIRVFSIYLACLVCGESAIVCGESVLVCG